MSDDRAASPEADPATLLREFAVHYLHMRDVQNAYFREKRQEDLREAKAREKLCDRLAREALESLGVRGEPTGEGS